MCCANKTPQHPTQHKENRKKGKRKGERKRKNTTKSKIKTPLIASIKMDKEEGAAEGTGKEAIINKHDVTPT